MNHHQAVDYKRTQPPSRVLHADDEILVCEAMTLFLTHLGIDVVSTPNIATCLETFRRERGEFDIVIISFDMPEENVPDAIDQLRHLNESVRIAVTSTHAEREVFPLIPNSETIGFLRKPYTLSKLRVFLLHACPPVPPEVYCVSTRESSASRWLEVITSKFSATICDNPQKALEGASQGFPTIVLWDVGSVDLRPDTLDSLRKEAIPVALIGDPDDQERFGHPDNFILNSAPAAKICEATLGVALGSAKSRALVEG